MISLFLIIASSWFIGIEIGMALAGAFTWWSTVIVFVNVISVAINSAVIMSRMKE